MGAYDHGVKFLRSCLLVVFASSGALAQGVMAQDVPPPPDPQEEQHQMRSLARSLFHEGLVCLDEGDWTCAADRFRRSNELYPSPVVAYNLASVEAERGRVDVALPLLRETANDPGAPAEVRAAASQRIRELEARRVRPAGEDVEVPEAPSVVEENEPAVFTSDRPGYANSTSVAARLRATTEFGIDFGFNEDGPESLSFPSLLIRTGLTDWLELRVGAPSLFATFTEADNDIFIGNTVVGFKIGKELTDSFALSLVPTITIPTSGGSTLARLELNWSLSLGTFGLSGNLAAGSTDGGFGRTLTGEGSIIASLQLSPTLGAFVQSFLIWTVDQDPRPFAGAGLYAMVHPRVQVDFTGDVGLTDDADDRLRIGVGTTVLWD